MVRRTSYDKLISVYLILKLHFEKIAVDKATEMWGPSTFYKPRLFTHTTNFHFDIHCSVLPTFSCDTLIPPCPKQVFPQSGPAYNVFKNFDVLLTVHLSIFISVINQLDAQNFCFTISLFHASTCFEHYCAHHQEVKIALHSLWYYHTETSEWSKITKIQFYSLLIFIELYFSNFRALTSFSVTVPEAV